MHRFFIPHESFLNPTVHITDNQEIHHLKNVLRLKKGDAVTLLNGEGDLAEALITSVKPDFVVFSIQSRRKTASKTTTLALGCALPKRSKFETIIEKCTELGVDEIFPLITERTEVKVVADKAPRKQQRFQLVARNAAKQSGQTRLPTIHPIQPLTTVLETVKPTDLTLIPCLRDGNPSILEIAQTEKTGSKRVLILIGPEGDFTDHEVKMACAKGFHPVSLGETVLKVETAAIAVTSLFHFLYGY